MRSSLAFEPILVIWKNTVVAEKYEHCSPTTDEQGYLFAVENSVQHYVLMLLEFLCFLSLMLQKF